LHALFVLQAETIQAGRQIVNEASRHRVGAQALKRVANPTGHELLSRPAGVQVSGLESCPERERIMSSPDGFMKILFVPCERAERPPGRFAWKARGRTVAYRAVR